MSQIEGQGELLNEFTGRNEPSEGLVDRARTYISRAETLASNPIYSRAHALYIADGVRFLQANSELTRQRLYIRRNAALGSALIINFPMLLAVGISHERFERRLSKEYGVAFKEPNPRSPGSLQYKKSTEHYARQLLEFVKPGGEFIFEQTEPLGL